MKKLLLLTTTLMITVALSAQVLHVPDDYPTIQEGIDAAGTGDTVLVDTGTYYENINYNGKAITVASQYLIDGDESHIENTIIDGSQASDPDRASTVMFVNGEDTTSVICGFTITGGAGYHNTTYNAMVGGGVMLENSGAIIENNMITDNEIVYDNIAGGAGIAALDLQGDSWLVVRNNTISNNKVTANISNNKVTANIFSAFGGGISSTLNSIIEYNIIEYNKCENIEGAQVDGGGIEIEQLTGSNPIIAEITGNTIRYNSLYGYDAFGAGISEFHTSEVYINNNDISNNSITAENNGFGGGVFCWDVSKTEISNNQINYNIVSGYRSYDAGLGINMPIGTVLVEENVFANNT